MIKSKYELSSGVQKRPVKAFIYGPEGIGKSTLAAQAPRAVFIDIEQGTDQLPVTRFPRPTSWTMLLDEIEEVRLGHVSCSTLVIDTADAAERLCIESVCAEKGKSGLEDFGYGQGYTYVKERYAEFLDKLSEVINSGINVFVLGHSRLDKFERPDESGAYDRFTPKLIDSRRASIAALVKEWSDLILFCNYKIYVTQDKTGKAKASGGKRVIYTTHNPCWEAKNRYGLNDELPLEWQIISFLIPDTGPILETEKATADKTGIADVTDVSDTASTVSTADVSQTSEKKTSAKKATTAKATSKKSPKIAKEVASDAQDSDKDIPPTPVAAVMSASTCPPSTTAAYPARLSKLADMMRIDGVTDTELRRAVAARGEYPEACPVEKYDPAYCDWLLTVWGSLIKKVKTMRLADEAGKVEIPF